MTKSFQLKILKLSTKGELEKVRDALENCVWAANILKLRKEVLLRIAEIEQRCERMSADNADMRECIEGFDRALLRRQTRLHSIHFIRVSELNL